MALGKMSVLTGDCVELMRDLEPASVDAVVCDPPYELGFMAKTWDSSGVAYRVETWAEALRVLKPGGHLLAFGGTRTYHRLACAIEDAGLEIRDTIAWMYGSGFPKSLNLNGDWQGWGTALKPAHEPIVVARKPLAGTVAGNVLEHGTGALNVDGCRIEGVRTGDPLRFTKSTRPDDRSFGKGGEQGDGGMFDPGRPIGVEVSSAGRWPANVVLDEEAAAMLDEQTGALPAGVAHRMNGGGNTFGGTSAKPPMADLGYGDSGGASRFFYCAKSSRAERNAGLEGFEESSGGVGDQRLGGDMNQRLHRDGRERVLARNTHPTVKPIALMRWLVRLVTPPGGLVLDPFTGSGTTGIAAGLEGFDFLGMEQDAAYAAIASARIAWWAEHGEEALRIVAERERAESERAEISAAGQLELL